MEDATAIETPEEELLSLAWGLIANAGEGNWDRETDEWHGAAINWRTKYHAYLDTRYPDAKLIPEKASRHSHWSLFRLGRRSPV